jgi:hypothetical protein
MMGNPEKPGQTQLAERDGNYVHVIRHQTIRDNIDTSRLFERTKQPEVGTIVRIIEKRLLAAITALCNVVGVTGNYNARRSRHDHPLSQTSTSVCGTKPNRH